jgi:hypothetical protein
MLHWLVVGHINPLDTVDCSRLPHKPKVFRAIPKDAAEPALDEFGRDIDPYLSYDEVGFVVCGWAQAPRRFWDRVHEFAFFLAEREGAAVMDERHMILWPPSAREVQQAAWSQRVENASNQEPEQDSHATGGFSDFGAAPA